MCIVQELSSNGSWARQQGGLTHIPDSSVAAHLAVVSSLQVCHPSPLAHEVAKLMARFVWDVEYR